MVRWCVRYLALGLAVAAFIVSFSSDAQAYAWMIQHGYSKCSTCHADPSGGELLSPFGRAQADLKLTMDYGGSGRPNSQPLWGLVNQPPWLWFGGSYRHMNIIEPASDDKLATFPMQADLYGMLRVGDFRAGASIGLSKVEAGSPHARAAQVTHGQGDELNLISRTHYIGMEWDKSEYFLRAGRLNVPFGLRIPEHVMWVREATRTDRDSDQQHGVAFAYSSGKLRGELMLIAGNYQIQPDKFRERGYALAVEGTYAKNSTLGISSQLTRADADLLTTEDQTTFRQSHGVTTRSTLLDSLVLLGEFDFLLQSRRDLGYVGMLQFDYEATQGLHFMLTGEVLDAGAQQNPGQAQASESQPGAGEPRWGGWASVNWFFLPQLQTRIDLLARQDDPFRILAQLHISL